MTIDLVVFVRARLDDDSDAIRANWNKDGVTSQRYHGTPFDPSRAMAEVETKRQMIATDDTLFCTDECWRPENTPADPDTNWTVTIPHHYDCTAYRIAQVLALSYTSHPDYRSEWAPTP